VVAVGGWPFIPAIPGKEHVITSNEAFHLEKLPARIVIVGSGYIGVEFAGIFNNLGSQVTLTFRSERLLPKFDEDVRQTLTEELEKKGIRILAGANVKEVRSGLRFVTDQGEVECDTVMYATGRNPNTKGLGLEELGVKLSKNGAVVVDDDYRTSVDNIYALGDCIDKIALTPVAIAEGRGLAETLYNNNPTRISYENIATAVFSQPPVGTVGLSEAEARKRHPGQVAVYRTKFRPMKHSLTGKDEKVLLKLLVHTETDRVLGCHMVGPDSPEIMQALGIAMTCGATKQQFDRTIALHPSTAEEFVLMREPVKEAARTS
jgi:glutathione reductase (NADPH)